MLTFKTDALGWFFTVFFFIMSCDKGVFITFLMLNYYRYFNFNFFYFRFNYFLKFKIKVS